MATLLIVDDDRIVLDLLSELFSGEHVCHTAGTAEDALARLGSGDYDVVITDLSMPGMSGEALLGFVKGHSPGTPVNFISGAKDPHVAERLRVKGAFDYLQKPFQLEEIVGTVTRAVKRRRPNLPGA